MRQHMFRLGELHMTDAVRESIPPSEMLAGFRKHANGDWGLVDEAQKRANSGALHTGGLLESRYRASNGREFGIVTEMDRSQTTAYMMDESFDQIPTRKN